MLFRYKVLNTVCTEGEVQLSHKGVEKETEKSIQIIRLSTISGFILVQQRLMPSCCVFLFSWRLGEIYFLLVDHSSWDGGDAKVSTYIFLAIQSYLTLTPFVSEEEQQQFPDTL